MDLRAMQYETGDGVAVVTFNRPQRLNAFTTRMELEYRWCLGQADADSDVSVIVVTGAGRGFCAGADYQALDQIVEAGEYGAGLGPADEEMPTPGTGVRPDFERTHTFPLGLRKPVIAAVNGPAAGLGLVLMCFCDIRFAAAGAKITSSFGRLGLPAEHGVTWMLNRIVGIGRAADILFSSRVVLAEEAAEMGLVNKVLPPDELMPFTLRYAKEMAAGIAPTSLVVMKRQLYADWFRELGPSADEAYKLMEDMAATPNFQEGVAAFQQQRTPKWEPLPPLS
jgi:enoyl-CoA hydratase/carnithine racemase